MGALASWGLLTMSAVGLLSLAMARFESEILSVIGYLIMIGSYCRWFVVCNQYNFYYFLLGGTS